MQLGDDMPETYNIIQITDWHVDFNYVEGSNRHCNFEICCQAEYGFPEVTEDRARKYGELTCDIPFETARKQMEAIVEYERTSKQRIDLILWTGDSVSHDVHRTT